MFATGITGDMEGISPHSIARTIRTDNESPFSQIMDVIENKNTDVTEDDWRIQ